MTLRLSILVLFTIQLSVGHLVAQTDVKIKKSKFRLESKSDEAYKAAWKNIKAAEKYFDLGPGTYMEARDFYLKAEGYNENRCSPQL
ncbi:MAG: hypothetical protein HC896_07490 [Bacteroidales bacterium]|nr:hypothetical protein [Bacteroidales bacterium]